MSNKEIKMNRRLFLKSTAITGAGLTIGASVSSCASASSDLDSKQNSNSFENAWVHIPKEGNVELICSRAEMGQGISTGFAMLFCEAFDYPIEKLTVKNAPADKAYNHKQYMTQATGGSTSIQTEWKEYLNIGASIRSELIESAAKKWKLSAKDLNTEKGFVVSTKGQKISYQELSHDLTNKTIKTIEFKYDPKKHSKFIGKKVLRVDNKSKIKGLEQYGIDTKNEENTGIKNPLIAIMVHPPQFDASPISCNEKELLALDGIEHVVKIDEGFAIVANKYWQAQNAKKLISAKWELPKKAFDTREYAKECHTLVSNLKGKEIIDEGESFLENDVSIEANYSVPYLAHATLEPQNCTVDINDERAIIWTSTQAPGGIKPLVSEISGLSEDKIKANSASLGGGFGRRGQPDAVIKAAKIGTIIKKPVKLIYSREDDMAAGYYRPFVSTKLKASMSKDGKDIFYKQSIATQSITEDILPTSMVSVTPSWISNSISRSIGKFVNYFADGFTLKEGITPPYNFKGTQIYWNKMRTPVPTLYWRSVGHTQNAFFMESFVDEIANKLSIDPMRFREERLKEHPRQLAVLKKVKEMSQWDQKDGRALGVASHFSFGSWAAAVIEVEEIDSMIKVKNVWTSIDCGLAINPDAIHAQLMGSAIFGLTAALYGKIDIHDGKVVQSNYHDYQLLTLKNTPKIETHIMDSTAEPAGVGEPGVPIMAPALCNAIYSLKKMRIRELPLMDHLDLA